MTPRHLFIEWQALLIPLFDGDDPGLDPVDPRELGLPPSTETDLGRWARRATDAMSEAPAWAPDERASWEKEGVALARQLTAFRPDDILVVYAAGSTLTWPDGHRVVRGDVRAAAPWGRHEQPEPFRSIQAAAEREDHERLAREERFVRPYRPGEFWPRTEQELPGLSRLTELEVYVGTFGPGLHLRVREPVRPALDWCVHDGEGPLLD